MVDQESGISGDQKYQRHIQVTGVRETGGSELGGVAIEDRSDHYEQVSVLEDIFFEQRILRLMTMVMSWDRCYGRRHLALVRAGDQLCRPADSLLHLPGVETRSRIYGCEAGDYR